MVELCTSGSKSVSVPLAARDLGSAQAPWNPKPIRQCYLWPRVSLALIGDCEHLEVGQVYRVPGGRSQFIYYQIVLPQFYGRVYRLSAL